MQLNETSDNTDENTMSSGIHEISPDQGHTLPILKKILDLSTEVQVNLFHQTNESKSFWILLLLMSVVFSCFMSQNLKKQHVALYDQVKLTTESFPGQDVLKSVQLLGKALT